MTVQKVSLAFLISFWWNWQQNMFLPFDILRFRLSNLWGTIFRIAHTYTIGLVNFVQWSSLKKIHIMYPSLPHKVYNFSICEKILSRLKTQIYAWKAKNFFWLTRMCESKFFGQLQLYIGSSPNLVTCDTLWEEKNLWEFESWLLISNFLFLNF